MTESRGDAAGRTVYVVVSCDVDPDRDRLFAGPRSGALTWRGATDGIPALKAAVRGLTDGAGREPAFTWLLRADEQIRDLAGEYASFVRTHDSLLQTLRESGDELGWHPHFWRREPATGAWYQETEDVEWQVAMLDGAHRALAAAVPDPVTSVRMGWSYHNNRTYQALDALGITTELSAIPGLRTFAGTPPRRSENLFDWHSTPRAPYRPSRRDYRRPPGPGETACRLLEVPSFVSTALPWGVVSGLQLARKTENAALLWHALRRPTYCINVTARPRLFAPLVSALRRTLRRRSPEPLVFGTQFHADELVPNRSGLYDLASVRANLAALLAACRAADAPVRFAPASRIAALFPA